MKRINNNSIVPSNIEELKPYIAGKTIAEVVEAFHPEQISKLASNENRYGHSEHVHEAVNQALKVIHDYPDPLSLKLRRAIAEKVNKEVANIIVGAGSESLLSILCRTFFNNKENIITSDVTFIGLYIQAKIRGVKVKKIPVTKDYRFDIKGMVNAIDENTKMMYIANPNNPTGTYISESEFLWLMENVPENVLVVMDEAYYEFTNEVKDYPNVLEHDFDNVIVLRTFSKGYGLAGFRVGYGIAKRELIDYMQKTRLTFEPGALSQAAALTALKDEEFLHKTREMIVHNRDDLYTYFEEKNIKYVPAITNFVMMVFETEEKAISINQAMLEKGVILRRLNAFGLPNCIRVTIGNSREMEHFRTSLDIILNGI